MARKGENIYKRKDGRWEARCITYYDETGKAHYKSVYAKTYGEAKSKKQKIAAADKAAAPKAAVQENRSFEKVCRHWLSDSAFRIKESSYVKYRSILENHVIPALGAYELAKINPQVLEKYFTGLLAHGKKDGKGMAAKSVADIKSVIKMVLIYAEQEGWTQHISIDHIAIKQAHRQVRVLDRDEQAQLERFLLSKASNVHMGIYICLYTGLRLGELCALRWEAVDFSSRLLSVERTMLRIKDYTAENGRKTKITETPPKSLCSMRKIPLPEFLLCALEQKSAGMQSQAYLLTGRADKYIEPRTMEYHFGKIITACGIRNANFHCLRHTFATRCVELGFDAKTLSEILGHASINITMNRYVHPSMELKRSNMEKLVKLSNVRGKTTDV